MCRLLKALKNNFILLLKNYLSYLNCSLFFHFTSGQFQNVGPSLRQYTVAPTSYRLDANRDPHIVIGKPFTMWASVPLNGSSVDIVKCQWTSPCGVTYNIDKDGVKLFEGNQIR